MKPLCVVLALLAVPAMAQSDQELNQARQFLLRETAAAQTDAADGGYRLCVDGQSGVGCSMRPCVSGLSFDGGTSDDCGNHINPVPADAPVVEDGPILFEADGKTAKHGRPTVVLRAGQPAPFPGRLVDAQEQTRREQINERNAAELKDLQQRNMILPTAAFWGILGGVALAAGGGAALAITRPWEHHQP
jgi:hypothetical protein